MKSETDDRWYKLCAEAAEEREPERFFELVKQIKDLFAAKQKQLRSNKTHPRRVNKIRFNSFP
jgi:hypothetical protein